jgi:PiT family inorganic phosphate transporter
MLSALIAAAIWLTVASWLGWPVSTTHSIIGAIVGFAIVGIGVEAVNWPKIGTIVLSWLVSPIVGGALSFFLMISIQKLILDTEKPLINAKRYAPYYVFLVGFVISLVTLFKGLKHLDIDLSVLQSFIFSGILALILTIISYFLINKIDAPSGESVREQFKQVEKIFGILMIFSASAMAFAHGSNDVANAIGPMSAIISVASEGAIGAKAAVSPWVLLIGGIGIVFGLSMLGGRVIKTVGSKITHLTPSLGFSAEMAAASTVVAATYIGFPISTTHTLVGAVIGVGLAKGVSHLDLSSIGRIILSWVVTIPAGASLTVLFYILIRLATGV